MSWCEANAVDYGHRTAQERPFVAPHQKTAEAGAAAFRQNGHRSAGIRGFPLPHAEELAAGEARGGQGGVSGEGCESALW